MAGIYFLKFSWGSQASYLVSFVIYIPTLIIINRNNDTLFCMKVSFIFG